MSTGRLARGRALGGPLLGGLGLIVLGVLLALAQLDLVDVAALLNRWWPVILLVLGGWWLLVGPRWTGAILVAVGALALAGIHLTLPVSPTELVVPTVLVLIGAGLLAAGLRLRRPVPTAASGARRSAGAAAAGAGVAAGQHLRTEPGATALLGDVHVRLDDPAVTEQGGVVRVPVTTLLGDVHVSVPPRWEVHDHTLRLLGDVTLPPDAPASAAATSAALVELHGTVLLGDVTVARRDEAARAPGHEGSQEEGR